MVAGQQQSQRGGKRQAAVRAVGREPFVTAVRGYRSRQVFRVRQRVQAQALVADAHLLRAHGDVFQTRRILRRQCQVSAYDTRFLFRELFHRLHELQRRLPVLYLLRDDMSAAQRTPVALPPHAFLRRLGQEQVAPVAQIRALVEVHPVAPCQEARTFLLPVGAVQLLYIPVLLVQYRVVGQYLDCLAPRGMDTLVFFRRYGIDLRQLHFEGCGDVCILRDDAPVFHRQQREPALQCGGFHYVSHSFLPFLFRLNRWDTRLRWSR